MTPITDMELPEAVIDAMFEAQDQIMRRYNEEDATSPMPFNAKQKRKEELMSATFRAALQALLDCGRMTQLTEEERTALHRRGLKWPKNIWLIRLDADERERALQEKRK